MGFNSSQLATASLIGQVGGVATSAIGSFFGASTNKINARTQAAIAESQASISDTNARIAELGAQSLLAQGQQQVGALTLKAGQLKGSQRAALAANGVDLGTGNAAEIQASADILKEIDSNTLTANAARSAWGYRTQATNYENEAAMKRIAASTTAAAGNAISPMGSAATSLIGGASNVASSWYQMKKLGAI